MKKIFAIALALVMVLSMASAFASACVTGPFNWDCATKTSNCAKATVEVVPYVKTNAACDEFSYIESDCAAAVNGENVYYALKLTVPKDIDPEWWAKSTLALSVKGMEQNWDEKNWAKPDYTTYGDASKDGWVFYHKIGTGWVEATENDDFDVADVMNKSVVKEYAKAKVCLTLKSVNEFTEATIGDYEVTYNKAGKKFSVTDEDGNYVVFTMDAKDKITDIDATIVNNCKTEYALINEVLAFLNLGCGYGVCITSDAMNANFGWNDEVKSCFAWKTQNAMAVVDSECVVAIPKTGDKGLLWWLF